MTRVSYFARMVRRVDAIEGDFVECGVHFGQGLGLLAVFNHRRTAGRHLWGFDSWEGLPSPTPEDSATRTSIATAGMFANSGREAVIHTFKTLGFSDEYISEHLTLVKGLFANTLASYRGNAIALLHIDADLYQSYRDCLTNLWPHIAIGGIAAFDEYHTSDVWPGARQAVDEFLRSLPPGAAELRQDEAYGAYFAVKLKDGL